MSCWIPKPHNGTSILTKTKHLARLHLWKKTMIHWVFFWTCNKSQNCTRLHHSYLLSLGHHATTPRKSPSTSWERGGQQHQLSCATPARKQRKLEPQRTARATATSTAQPVPHVCAWYGSDPLALALARRRMKANDSVDQRPPTSNARTTSFALLLGARSSGYVRSLPRRGSTQTAPSIVAANLWAVPSACSGETIVVSISWSYDMEGHAKKCVERHCELANKTTQQLYKVSTPCIDDHHFKEEETKFVGELSTTCSQIVLMCSYLARIGRPDILWSVNKLARSVTKWTKACDKRLNRLISYIHHTCEYKQYCHVGNTAKRCRLGLFQDSDFEGDLEDSKSISGGTLCVLGSHAFVPISWMCKKQTAVSHSSTES